MKLYLSIGAFTAVLLVACAMLYFTADATPQSSYEPAPVEVPANIQLLSIWEYPSPIKCNPGYHFQYETKANGEGTLACENADRTLIQMDPKVGSNPLQ